MNSIENNLIGVIEINPILRLLWFWSVTLLVPAGTKSFGYGSGWKCYTNSKQELYQQGFYSFPESDNYVVKTIQ